MMMMMQGGGSVRVQSRVSLPRLSSGSVLVQFRVCRAIRGVSGQLSYLGQRVSWSGSRFASEFVGDNRRHDGSHLLIPFGILFSLLVLPRSMLYDNCRSNINIIPLLL
ncbi:hypothetical protein Hanom_Chr13g01228711 [Helianthus anomalus]